MHRFGRSMVLLVMALGLAATAAADGRTDLERAVFTIEGMHCDGCSATITATLERVEGVMEAVADHEKGRAEVVYRPREVAVEELEAEIEKLGYTVTAVTTEAFEG